MTFFQENLRILNFLDRQNISIYCRNRQNNLCTQKLEFIRLIFPLFGYHKSLMIAVPHFILSLVLTACISFSAPIILVGVIFTALFAIGYVPGLTEFGSMGVCQIVNFLRTFGAGNPIQGIITIGLACGLVGGLFDLFNLYCDRSLRDDTKCSTESDWTSSRLRDCAQRTDGVNR